MEGLEINEVNLSYLKNHFRIDSEFYRLADIEMESLLISNNSAPLGRIARLFDGPFGSEFLADGYEIEGVPILRMQNVNENGLFNHNNLELISESDANKLIKYTAYPGEVVSTKIGFLGFTTVLPSKYPKYVFRRELTRFEITNTNIDPYYLSTFLNSKYGRAQFYRYASGTSRDRVLLINQREALIPQFSSGFQSQIKNNLITAFERINESEAKYTQAENLLLETLGLDDFQPSQEPVNVKSFSESFGSSGRLDAEYYQIKYEDFETLVTTYSGGQEPFEIACSLKDKNFNPEDKTEYKYIELANIGKSGEITDCTTGLGEELPSRARRKVATNDVVVSSIEGSLDSCALVTAEYNNALCSTGFYVVKSKKLNPETLLVLFKSAPMQALLKKGCSGTILTAISKTELSKIPIPLIDKETQESIKTKINESFELRKQSEHLLEVAKITVEMAIEQDEQAAIQFINQIVN